MRIVSVGRAFPENYYSQEALLAALREFWGPRFHNPRRLVDLHRNVLVGGRHLALPMEDYPKLSSFGEANDAFIHSAVDLGERAIRDALERASLEPRDIRHLFFVSVTGLATRSRMSRSRARGACCWPWARASAPSWS